MKWLLVGASDIAETRMIPAMREVGHSVVGVVSGSAERARSFAEANAVPNVTTDLAESMSWGAEAAYISSTNQLHAQQAIACAQAGLHVLCEKPVAMNLVDANSAVEAAQSAGVVFATNHHLRNKGTIRRIREMVAAGEIGDVVAVRLQHAVSLPDRLRGWRLNDAAAGGGVILDITVHDADTLRFVTGREVVAVSAMAASQGLGIDGVEDSAVVTMRLDDGSLAVAHESFVVPHPGTQLEIHGSTGSIVAPGALNQSSDGEVLLLRSGETRAVAVEDRRDVYVVGLLAFAAAVAEDSAPAATGLDGIRSLEVALAALSSAREERVISLPLPGATR